MRSQLTMKNPKQQKGLILVILVIIVVLAFISYIVSEMSQSEIRSKQEEKTMIALKKAKQALLAYAMNYPDTGGAATQGPGNFPCPAELDGEQKQAGAIGAGSSCNPGLPDPGAIGRFPWKTVETGELYDGSGELLWYAISKNYAAVANGEINTSTTGQITTKNRDGTLRVDGTSLDAIIAVIIAPGETLERDDDVVQSRSTVAEKLDAINYLDIAFSGDALEEDNALYFNENVNDGFIRGPVFNAANEIIVNDVMVTITYGEIMELVHARVGDEISNLINAYVLACDAYPEASGFDPTKGVFDSRSEEMPQPAPPDELKRGLLPVDQTRPADWGTPCFGVFTPALPAWIKAEEWHLHTYYEYAYTNKLYPTPPPAIPTPPGTPCTPGIDCLTVNNTEAPTNDKNALIVFAGRDVNGTRPIANPTQYFEGQNNDFDLIGDPNGLIYDAAQVRDYVRVISP